ncbi:hypothetical protein L9Z41_03125 [Leptospira noguchii]|nr:hypothetical protein [Leptospira noguchii]MCH1911593.1 hypothetical protein [Leptospira noguchii]MCH1914668.1 hypothetical protein [Leptospira noguchii]UOG64582.1 hypothetical protein MAL04_03130 [Leptospira noguchii]
MENEWVMRKYIILVVFCLSILISFCAKEKTSHTEEQSSTAMKSSIDEKCIIQKETIEKYFKFKFGDSYKSVDFSKIEYFADDQGRIDDQILGYVCCFPNLISLTASWSKNVTDIGVKNFVECRLKNHGQRMNGINFQGTSITNESVKSLSELKEVGELFLDDNDKINDTAIQYFKKFTSIGSLSIVATGITAEGAEKLRKMKHIQGVDSEYHVPANQE